MKLRLFVGITAPEEWRIALTKWRRKIQPRLSESFGRWTSESNLHLTLRFFGSIEEADVAPLAAKLQEIAPHSSQFTVGPADLGCFPNPTRPRILWLGLSGATEALVKLESEIRAASATFGKPPDNRPFHPHLTLARLKNPTRQDRDAIAELLRRGAPIDVPAWPVNSFELIRSEPKPEGSVYTPIASFPLTAPHP
jgi:2'-5' RNA ligase